MCVLAAVKVLNVKMEKWMCPSLFVATVLGLLCVGGGVMLLFLVTWFTATVLDASR